MKSNTLYRILSFILIPPALLFSIAVLILIAAAIANPPMLLPMFMIACVSIYTFTSFNFLLKGIDGGKMLGRSAKDWIKVNAIVSIIFAILMLAQSFVLTSQPELMKSMLEEVQKQSATTIKLSEQELLKYIKAMLIIFLIYSTILFIHTIITFRLLKQYNNIFTTTEN